MFLGGAYFLFREPAEKVEVTPVVAISPSRAVSVLNASGYVIAIRKAAIASKGTGRLVFLKVKEGDTVKKGEILARLENADVLAALSRSEANVGVSESAVSQAETELNENTLIYHRGEDLLKGGLISKSEFDGIEARYLRARASLDAARAGLRMAEASRRSAEVDVENTTIRAPFNGTVLARNAEVGEVVAPFGSSVYAKSAVLTIADISSLEVDADVSESNIEKITVGQECEITLDAYAAVKYNGKVKTIVPTADRAKATVLVKIEILNPDGRIFPEMSAKVAFLGTLNNSGPGREIIAVRPGAIVNKNDRKVVFLVRNQTVTEVAVETGPSAGGMVEIKKGLRPGDRVVINPSDKLSSGKKVVIQSGG